MSEQDELPSFETMFGFREPTEDEVRHATESLVGKFNSMGDPVSTKVFRSNETIAAFMDLYVFSMTESYAEDRDIPIEQAYEMVIAGFVGAIEMIGTIHLCLKD